MEITNEASHFLFFLTKEIQDITKSHSKRKHFGR